MEKRSIFGKNNKRLKGQKTDFNSNEKERRVSASLFCIWVNECFRVLAYDDASSDEFTDDGVVDDVALIIDEIEILQKTQ